MKSTKVLDAYTSLQLWHAGGEHLIRVAELLECSYSSLFGFFFRNGFCDLDGYSTSTLSWTEFYDCLLLYLSLRKK